MNIDVAVGPIQTRVRSHSKAIFGKRYRLEVIAAAGASEDPIWSRRLAELLHLPENQVSGELQNLANLGALQSFPAQHDRRKLFQCVPHPIWGFARELVEHTIAELYPGEPRQASAAYWFQVMAIAEPQPVPV
ncbi:MAG TPA: hypothetical protein VHP56_00360 [Solirubrobacterales bacterium]|jgi:hypothetical protein|nr:hypothetical protein [Solirubrobacterales bacterium]